MRRIATLILLSLTACAGSNSPGIFCDRPIPPATLTEDCAIPDIDRSARRALVDHRVALAECAARHHQLARWAKDAAGEQK